LKVERTEPSILGRLLRVTAIVEDALLVLILAAMVALSATQIILRNLFDGAILWADPMLRVAVLWVGMIGAMVATRSDRQISIDAVSRFLSLHWRARVRVMTDLFTAAVSTVVAWSAYRLVLDDRAAGITDIAFVPVWICEAVLPVAFGTIALRYLLFAIKHFKESARKEGRS
jgi:TRAP-type C4-dicarboxylate transport system permease small subunit